MLFLYTLVIPQLDGSLETTVYWKPIHTDQYLHWDSHHTISAKYSMVSTLHHRARAICSNPQLLKREEHLQEALSKCMYSMWALNRMKMKSRPQTTPVHNITGTNTSSSNTSYNKRPHMVVLHIKGLGESLKNV